MTLRRTIVCGMARLGIPAQCFRHVVQHLFEKTGTRRQTELVKLLAGHASPIRT